MGKEKWIHQYKGFNIIKNGTRDYPWNIYKDDGHGFGEHVGYDRTLRSCKAAIDDGAFEDGIEEDLDDFDKRWEETFGKYVDVPLTIEEFNQLTREMIEFE